VRVVVFLILTRHRWSFQPDLRCGLWQHDAALRRRPAVLEKLSVSWLFFLNFYFFVTMFLFYLFFCSCRFVFCSLCFNSVALVFSTSALCIRSALISRRRKFHQSI
jgi:hypothetical protein